MGRMSLVKETGVFKRLNKTVMPYESVTHVTITAQMITPIKASASMSRMTRQATPRSLETRKYTRTSPVTIQGSARRRRAERLVLGAFIGVLLGPPVASYRRGCRESSQYGCSAGSDPIRF